MSAIRKYPERCKPWTDEEDLVLLEKYSLVEDIKELEGELNRTARQIMCRAHRLKLCRNKKAAKESMMRAAKERAERKALERATSENDRQKALERELAELERQIDEGMLSLPADKLRELLGRRSSLVLKIDKSSASQYANTDIFYNR